MGKRLAVFPTAMTEAMCNVLAGLPGPIHHGVGEGAGPYEARTGGGTEQAHTPPHHP